MALNPGYFPLVVSDWSTASQQPQTDIINQSLPGCHVGLMKFIAASVLLVSVAAALPKTKFGKKLHQLQNELVMENEEIATVAQKLKECPADQLTQCALDLLGQYGEVDAEVRADLEKLGNTATTVHDKVVQCSTTDNEEVCKLTTTKGALPELVNNAKQVLTTVKMAYPGAFEIPEMGKLEEILSRYDEDSEAADFKDELKEGLQSLESRFRSLAIA